MPATSAASSWPGRTVARRTSTTRLAFSSITPMSVHVRYWVRTMKMRMTPISAVASSVVRACLPGLTLLDRQRLGLGHGGRLPPGSGRPGRRFPVLPELWPRPHVQGLGGRISSRDGILHEDPRAPSTTMSEFCRCSTQRERRSGRARGPVLRGSPTVVASFCSSASRAARAGDHAHPLARGGPGVDGGDDHGSRHHGEEDEGNYSQHTTRTHVARRIRSPATSRWMPRAQCREVRVWDTERR